jgi:ABC-type dipeptide/oligopeptide/nickel transport system ATPase component
MMADLNIKYFDPSKIKQGAVILIIGRRGCGKSTVAEDLLSYKRDCRRGLAVSATERMNRFWSKHIPRCFIRYEFDEEDTRSLFRTQERTKKKYGECDPAFIIYDDLLFDRKFARSKEVRRVLMNGRHSALFTILTAQYILDIGPDLRSNIDYVFVLRDNIRANREKVWTYFAGMFSDFNTFDACMQACTQNHECMVLDQTALSYNPSDCVFFYKATPDLSYKVCAREFWEFSQTLGEDDKLEEDDTERRGGAMSKIKKEYPLIKR